MTIDELEKLEAAATAGPWEWDSYCRVFGPFSIVLVCSVRPVAGDTAAGQHADNAAFIPALRNHAKALLAVAKAAEKCCIENAPCQYPCEHPQCDLRKALTDLEAQ